MCAAVGFVCRLYFCHSTTKSGCVMKKKSHSKRLLIVVIPFSYVRCNVEKMGPAFSQLLTDAIHYLLVCYFLKIACQNRTNNICTRTLHTVSIICMHYSFENEAGKIII